MTLLYQQNCEVCRGDSPPVSEETLLKLCDEIPLWTVKPVSSVMQLQRVFVFDNYLQALSFTQQVGELAESFNHHPAILTEWGKVTVTWWTHTIKGLHRNDFIMAAKTDRLYR